MEKATNDIKIKNMDQTIKNKCGKSQFELLINKGWIFPQNDGQFIINEKFYEVMQLFDTAFFAWAKKDGAKEYFYPDFYTVSDLDNCDYIKQFHGHCMFTGTTTNDLFDIKNLRFSKYINNPAICMHCYIQHRNTVINEEKPIVITAKGRCKRNERNGFISLERMLDFTMREIVFIGTKDFVLFKRQEYIERAKSLLETLHLEGNISLSNDPFFKKEDNIKAEFQRKFKLKYELNLKNYDNGHSVAVGSFNYHNYNFTKAYNIKMTNGNLAHTACIAFGLERIAYTYITQVGIDGCYQRLNEYIQYMD
ncbi:MAG: hypothetical protein KIC77_05680 [Clostridiales bacterium]|nr:hypothetical protein [Clostridiales bacterium]